MTKTFALKMLAALEDALLKNVGVGSVSIDGHTISFSSRAQLLSEYMHWTKEVATASGRRRLFRPINISGGAQA